MTLAKDLQEDFRRDALGRIKSVSILGIRSDSLLISLKKDARYAQLDEVGLQAEMVKMVTNGWVVAEPVPLASSVVNYKLTPQGRELCYELGI